MFYYIEGNAAEIEPNLVVLDCGGVGYALNATTNTISYVKKGERTKLYVSEIVKEDAFDLYGFYSKAEKRFLAAIAAASEMLTSIVPSAWRYDLVFTVPLTGGVALRGTMLALTVISSDPSAAFWTSLIVTVLVHQCLELSGEYLS